MKKELIPPFNVLFILCVLIAAGYGAVSCKPDSRPAAPQEDTVAVVDSGKYFLDICIDSLDVAHNTVRPGDNLSLIFHRLGLSPLQTDSIVRTTSDLLDPKKIRSGNRYYTLTTCDGEARLKYIVFARTPVDHVVIDLSYPPIGAYLFRKEIVYRQQYLEGSVKSSLWNEIRNHGVDPLLAIRLADIYAWQIDFFAVQPQDSFRMLYTEAFVDSTVSTGVFSIDGAEFIHEGRTYPAILFAQDSTPEFFDIDGQSLRKAFLKAPLDYFRITSRFSNSRFHPILKRYRAHHGVDYAAPTGTPVKTIGDGKVVAKGFERGGGNYLKIQHNSMYTTSYMHLHRFAGNVGVGKHVRQGDVIGYVGSTGLSTGPHLDFRVYKNGQAIDPLKMESPPSHPVKPELRDSFESVKYRFLNKIRTLSARDTLAVISNQIISDNN
ncbi:MAG: peptidoglycan DD-metalloendopeptidase family protein [Tannerella sp.]|jgi:murein DD-endopeptidase MepM/ murein hydrolase activator NlpD|nr:peptidoglycan DD-metalloendopeptidase family protein [Tannerella sp.]